MSKRNDLVFGECVGMVVQQQRRQTKGWRQWDMLLGQPGLLSKSERLLTLRAFSNLPLLRNQQLNLQLHKRKPSKGLLLKHKQAI